MQNSPFSSKQNDHDSGFYLEFLQTKEQIEKNRIPNVKTVLVVFPSKGLAFDAEGLRSMITREYPGSEVFFLSTSGKAWKSPKIPSKVDLAIDFTGEGQMQGWFFARKIKSRAKFVVGRNKGIFRKRIYDRIFDETKITISTDMLDRERLAQKEVLALAGIAVVPVAGTTVDRSKIIALDLPPLQKH
ncbi:MAG: hypothetical protein KA715_10655 [Xanthomonadaceae bacterium]|nr:hypothetical protein [Xanthomonadaceae bacterium]